MKEPPIVARAPLLAQSVNFPEGDGKFRGWLY